MACSCRQITVSSSPRIHIEAAALSDRMDFRMIMRIGVIIAFIAALITIAVVTRSFLICYIPDKRNSAIAVCIVFFFRSAGMR